MKDTKISIFRHLYESKDVPYVVTLEKALNRIKNGAKSLNLIEKIRTEQDKEKRDALKRNLPCYVFSGEFKERNSGGLVNHSGIFVADVDDFQNEEEQARLFQELKNNVHVLSVFKSPSGNKGLKALIRIPKCNAIDHARYFKAFYK